MNAYAYTYNEKSDWIQVTEPDIPLLQAYIRTCMGHSNLDHFSKITHCKIKLLLDPKRTKPADPDTLYRIFKYSSANSIISLRQLLSANGMVYKEDAVSYLELMQPGEPDYVDLRFRDCRKAEVKLDPENKSSFHGNLIFFFLCEDIPVSTRKKLITGRDNYFQNKTIVRLLDRFRCARQDEQKQLENVFRDLEDIDSMDFASPLSDKIARTIADLL